MRLGGGGVDLTIDILRSGEIMIKKDLLMIRGDFFDFHGLYQKTI
jgi:hypothetical protein